MAKRVRFTADFDYRPKPRVTVSYKAGTTLLVPEGAASAALAKGKATLAPNQPRIR